jgi:DNA-binding transcriptional LysR family regulator
VLVADLLAQGALVALDEEPFVTSLGYFLVYPSFSGLSPAARTLRSWILKCSADMRELHGLEP